MQKILLSLLLLISICSCGKRHRQEEDVLLRFGDKVITKNEVEDMIPNGLSPVDSAALFEALVDSWIRNNVLMDFAKDRLYDIDAIERRVDDYRNHLIVQEYVSRMLESKSQTIEEAKVKEYYNLHKAEIKLEVPLIKGIFLKINSDMPGKEDIGKLMSTGDLEDLDILEQNWLDRVLEYNYFRDKWIDWETVSGMIPYRFGDPDTFLEGNRYFMTEYGDCTFYLQISDYLPSGSLQPYDFAKTWITDVLTRGALADYERMLVNSLTLQFIKENKLDVVGYDPLLHKMIEKKDINENK